MLNAFCRVAPSVLFNFLAILAAGVFIFAIVFSSRTSPEVHARRFFDFFAIEPPFRERQLVSRYGVKRKPTDRLAMWISAVESLSPIWSQIVHRRYGRDVNKQFARLLLARCEPRSK
jgi:hypothetical protein